MKFDGFECDHCGETYNQNEFGMIEIKGFEMDDEFDFCSWFCMKHFFDLRFEHMDETKFRGNFKFFDVAMTKFNPDDDDDDFLEPLPEFEEVQTHDDLIQKGEDMLLSMLYEKREEIRQKIDKYTFILEHREWSDLSDGAIEVIQEEKEKHENELFDLMKYIKTLGG